MTVKDMDISLNISTGPAAREVSERLQNVIELLFSWNCIF